MYVLGTSKSGSTGAEGVKFVQSQPVEGACWIWTRFHRKVLPLDRGPAGPKTFRGIHAFGDDVEGGLAYTQVPRLRSERGRPAHLSRVHFCCSFLVMCSCTTVSLGRVPGSRVSAV